MKTGCGIGLLAMTAHTNTSYILGRISAHLVGTGPELIRKGPNGSLDWQYSVLVDFSLRGLHIKAKEVCGTVATCDCVTLNKNRHPLKNASHWRAY
jgi:hypothetical protein